MMNHRIVLAALPLLAGLAHGQAWELPEEVPTAPIFNDQTIVLVSSFPIAELTDLDLDGFVTDRDFRLYIASKLADTLTIKDINGDGVITATDEVGSLAILLDKLSGDTNGDGVKDAADTADFLDLYTNPVGAELAFINNKTADLNLDGQVTGDDFALYLNAFAIAELPDRITVAVDLLANIIGTLTNTEFLEGHIVSISETWGEHNQDNSFQKGDWPANHDAEFSERWTHNGDISSRWPPYHESDFSQDWTDQGHNYDRSDFWPAYHSFFHSDGWYPAISPPHARFLSITWSPDHVLSLSRSFPPSHAEAVSTMRDEHGFPDAGNGDWPEWPTHSPGSHHSSNWSVQWSHRMSVSRVFYPTNHQEAFSITWAAPQHTANISLHWPANHMMLVSSYWPNNDGYPPNWPANHGLQTSKDGEQFVEPPEPFRFPRLFPNGHDVSTTIMDWIPFFPTLVPTP